MNEERRHPSNREHGDDALTRLLRAADPAAPAAGEGLDAVERAHLRQRVTAAAERHANAGGWNARRPAWVLPALAAAALVTAVGLAFWSLRSAPAQAPGSAPGSQAQAARRTPGGGEPAPGTRDAAADDIPISAAPQATVADAGSAPPQAAVVTPPAAAATVGTDPVELPRTLEPTAATPTVVASDTPSPPEREPRTVQFTAPRGTRIIWTLDPKFESPIAGEPRQEQ